MEELFQYLANLYPLSDELKAALVSRIHKETFRKNRPLLSAGQFCDWIGFIERGLTKTCYDIPDGEERIIGFTRPEEMICLVKSYTGATPARASIVAIEETVIWKLRRVEAEALSYKYPPFHWHLHRILEGQAAIIEDHYMLLGLPARGRFEWLVNQQGWIIRDKRIRQYAVASYLGIDQATYSRWVNGKG